jgi:hypothetical protein
VHRLRDLKMIVSAVQNQHSRISPTSNGWEGQREGMLTI